MYNSQEAYQNIVRLQNHASENVFILNELCNDRNRKNYCINLSNINIDYSRNLINDNTLKLFEECLKNCNIKQNITNLISGKNINELEKRPALHIALRTKHDLIPKYIEKSVEESLIKMEEFAKNLPTNITDVIHIGIGGSDVGPRFVYKALKANHKKKLNAHFLNNIDGEQLEEILSSLTPNNTIVLVCSKTFTTLETCENLNACIDWLKDVKNYANHLVAITACPQKAKEYNIKHIFDFGEWVGGRFSVWSCIGLVIILCYGIDVFKEFLLGANQVDINFINESFENNASQILAMLGIWYRNVFNISNYCIAPYSQNLKYFSPYLQQLDMESNGKSVGIDNKTLPYHTAPVIFGEVGTQCQHSYFQLLHQGTQWMPVDFITYSNPNHKYQNHHKILLNNCYAQAKALMIGKIDSNPHFIHVGNRPSNILMLRNMNALSLGNLLALYEHKIFTQGIFWHINSFDQWGVEFGKQLAKENLYEDCYI